MRINLTDNNIGQPDAGTFLRKDVAALFPIADKTVAQLCRENENLLIFPYSIESSDDRIGESSVMSILNTDDSEKVRITTGNVMGFFDYNLPMKAIYFDDGTVWDQQYLQDNFVKYIRGTDGDDTINDTGDNDTVFCGMGNDYIKGRQGDDRYIYNLGDGCDTINDSTLWGNGYNRTIYLTEEEIANSQSGTWYVYPFITPNGVRDEGGVDVPFNTWHNNIGKNITHVPPAFGLTAISLPTTENGSTNPPIVMKSSHGGAYCTTTMTISNLTWYNGAFKFKFTIVATNSGVLEFTSTSSYHIYVLDPDDTKHEEAEDYYNTHKILGERSIGKNIYIDLKAGKSATYTQTTWDSDATDGIVVPTPYIPADRPQTTRLQIMVVSDDGKVSAWEFVNYR